MDYPSRTRRNVSILQALETFERDGVLKNIRVAGRVVGLLDGGFVLQDETARIDLLYKETVNVGDIVEAEISGKTQYVKGRESTQTYFADKMKVLTPCKADFFIGKGSPNYLKMVIDRRMREFFNERAKIVKRIRDFFWDKGFTEVETPELVKLPGMEPYLDVFKTTFTGLPMEGIKPAPEDMYLITSPEYAMKKLLVSGYEKIFQITRSFRNKEHESSIHNPEFTILEWYRAYASYEEIMKDTENLVSQLAVSLYGEPWITFQQSRVNVGPPWDRFKVKDLFQKYADIPAENFEDEEKFYKAVRAKGYHVTPKTLYEDLFFMVFLNEIEPKLGHNKPAIVYEYPVKMAALAKKCSVDPGYAERFEVYIAGMELCNAFTELNDPEEQKQRLEDERKKRVKLGKDVYSIDRSFIRALEFGMPPAGGIALGVDRLAMLLTGITDIRDLIFFPQRDL